MQAPDIMYEFYIKDAHAHWSIHCDGISVTESCGESGVTINGVKADAMFTMCRNALCSRAEYSVFHELSKKPQHISAAKEMIETLQSFVDENTTKEEEVSE